MEIEARQQQIKVRSYLSMRAISLNASFESVPYLESRFGNRLADQELGAESLVVEWDVSPDAVRPLPATTQPF